jgi:arylsulfatase A-like enzyme
MIRASHILILFFATVQIVCAAEQRPNIVFAFSDEHRWQSMGFTETAYLKTPTMDRLAKEDASFKACISNNPLCVPSRFCMLSGAPHLSIRTNERNPNQDE